MFCHAWREHRFPVWMAKNRLHATYHHESWIMDYNCCITHKCTHLRCQRIVSIVTHIRLHVIAVHFGDDTHRHFHSVNLTPQLSVDRLAPSALMADGRMAFKFGLFCFTSFFSARQLLSSSQNTPHTEHITALW